MFQAPSRPFNDENFVSALRKSIETALEAYLKDEYETKKQQLMLEMDKRFYGEVAAIALELTNLCDFSMMQDRLVITVHKKEPETK
jgi:hypothetical protein